MRLIVVADEIGELLGSFVHGVGDEFLRIGREVAIDVLEAVSE